MDPGDVRTVETGECSDIYYVETGMFDTTGYGCVYICDTDRPTIVDTGTGTNYMLVLAGMREVGIYPEDLEVIALTHAHLDHAGGAGYLLKDCPHATAYVHEAGAPHLVDPAALIEGTKAAVGELWDYYVEPEPIPEDRLETITDGDELSLGDRYLIAHEAPGHASHQVVFESQADDAVFTADAAGIYVQDLDRVEPSSPPPTFNPDQVKADVDMIADLNPSTLLYPHFGPAPTDNRLEEYKAVIEEWVETVTDAATDAEDMESLAEEFAEEAPADLHDAWSEHKARGEAAMNVRGVWQYLDYIDAL